MDISPLVGLAVRASLLLVALLGLIALYRVLLHPLRRIPGPFLAKVTELWRTKRYFNGQWHDDILSLHKKYGPVVRIAPNEVSVVHPDLTTTAFGYGSSATGKTSWYHTWTALGGSSSERTPVSFFAVQNQEKHALMRKRVANLYSLAGILTSQEKIQTVLDSLWAKFDGFARAGQEINLSTWAFFFTYDVVGTICWSEPLGMIREERDVGRYIHLMHEAFYWIANLGHLPGNSFWTSHPLTPYVAPFVGSDIHLSAAPFRQQTFQKVMARMKEGRAKDAPPKDMLDSFIALRGPDGNPLPFGELMAEVGNPMAAGADTTSIGIRVVLAPLLRSDPHYRRLRDELDRARREASLGPSERLPYDALANLPFLSACIKEGGRMHPSVVYNLPRKVPVGGATFDRHFVPDSATVSFSPMAQNRCRAIFGDDADEWRPERWIEGEGSSEAELKRMNKLIATFGYGSRACVGRNLALVEMYNFIAQIVTRYDIELVDKDVPLKVRSSWIANPEDMRIRLKIR